MSTGDKKIRFSTLRRIIYYFLPHLKPFRRSMIAAFLCTLAVTLMSLLAPWPMKFIFDVILIPQPGTDRILQFIPGVTDQPQFLIALVVIALLVIAVLTGLFGYGMAYLTAATGQKVVASVRNQVYSHIQHLSKSFHDEMAAGQLLARLVSDIRLLRQLLVSALIQLSESVLILVGLVLVMLWMDWQLTLVAVAVVPMLAMTVVRFGREIKQATRKQRRRESAVTTIIHEKLSSIGLVQAYGRSVYEEQRFAKQNLASTKAGVVTTRLAALMSRRVQIILAVGMAAVLWLGVLRVEAGVLTPGDLLVFIAYLRKMYRPIRRLSGLTKQLAKSSVSGERIVAILDTKSEITDAPDAIPAPPFQGLLEFRDVHFGYKQGKEVLSGMNLRIVPHETIALVGESGVGKSTLASLILRLYDPKGGAVLIDGTDIRSYQLTSLRDQIAIVLQESVLFNASIEENIAYGKLDASTDEIVSAAKIANAHQFIEQLPEGYQTMVGERGQSLSGGQRQRIAIARAVVRRASIVILDEPTIGLDPDSRKEVETALVKLTRERTCLLITHDASLARLADRVLTIRAGQVEEGDPGQYSVLQPIQT